MKTIKNNKGFTLIELLAVIVVLAIVMVLAVTTVLPYMERAKKNAFVVEANSASDAASKAMNLVELGKIKNTDSVTYYTETTKGYCFTIEQLAMAGVIEKVNTAGYDGLVYVDSVENSKSYTYTVLVKNSDYYVNGSGTINIENIKNVSDVPTNDTNSEEYKSYQKILGNCIANRG